MSTTKPEPTKTAEQQIKDIQSEASNKIAAYKAEVKEATAKLDEQGKHLDAAKAEASALAQKVEQLEEDLAAARQEGGISEDASHEVRLEKPAPFNGKTLPKGALIGTITPIDGESTDYVVDAVRTGYAKCFQCKKPAKKEDKKSAEKGGDQS